ncbi:MAG: hypothetical protein HN509_15620 [Halobacteriovoraceae bacterium]|jgi:hypothetical protein|nr:hypothetical protein [Halobacteriovoraceae bacterium]MBT5095939.1 hypothetical protein [Halobacteriovoraceae bacterium]
MKTLLALTLLFTSTLAFAGNSKTITGLVKLDKKLASKLTSSSVLYIFAKKIGHRGPPAAVLKVPSPKFPHKFSLSAKNAMFPGTPFDGPFKLTARLTTNGDVMEKAGSYQGILSPKNGIAVGTTKNKILIDTPR